MASGHRKWIIAMLTTLLAILLVVIKLKSSDHVGDGSAAQPETAATVVDASAEGGAAGEGALTIWVPTGLVGDNYWVYLDGHIVSSPPHSDIAGKAGIIFPDQRLDDQNHPIGWDIQVDDPSGNVRGGFSIRHGYFLIDNANFRSYIKQHLDPASGDSMGLFSAVNLPIQPGNYVVEVVYFSHNEYYSSFPFAISPKYQANVGDRGRKELYIGVPDDWERVEKAAAAHGNPSCDEKPDASYILNQMNAYLDDPVVQELTAKLGSSNDDSVSLDLPIADGGSREYDRVQIRYIANAILGHYYNIDHETSQSYIDDCKISHPEWSKTFDQYGKIVSDVKGEFQFVHRLAGQ